MMRWTPARIVAAGIIVGQILFCAVFLPLGERWFLHPDDYEAYVFADITLERGAPVKDYEPSPYTRFSAFEPSSSIILGDKAVVNRPPGLIYLLAPVTPLGVDAANLWLQALVGLTLVALFLLLDRLYGEWPAAAGLALFAFAAPVLFWSQFFYGNVLGMGLLFIGVWLMLFDRPIRQFWGALILGLSLLFRFEYLIIVAPLALGWLVHNAPRVRAEPRRYLYPMAGGALGMLVVVGMSLYLYDTWNFVGVTVRQSGSGASSVARSVTYTAGAVQASNLERNYTRFIAPLLLVPVALFPVPFLFDRRPRWPVPYLVIGTAILLWFFLGNTFSPQRFFMAQAYVRYIVPACAVGAIGVAHLMRAIPRRNAWIAIVSAVALTSVGSLEFTTSNAGFGGAREYLSLANKHVDEAKDLPGPSVFVGEHLGKMLLDVDILIPIRIPSRVRQNETVDIVHRLLDNGTHVYLSAVFGPDYRTWISQDGGLRLVRVSPSYFEARRAETGP